MKRTSAKSRQQNNDRTLLFSVTKNDLIRQTFRCPGKGGQNVNKRDTGVRFIHEPSGARGESCTHRTQHQNEVEAFRRLVETFAFKRWHKTETTRRLGQRIPETDEQIRARVDRMIDKGIQNGSIIIEEV